MTAVAPLSTRRKDLAPFLPLFQKWYPNQNSMKNFNLSEEYFDKFIAAINCSIQCDEQIETSTFCLCENCVPVSQENMRLKWKTTFPQKENSRKNMTRRTIHDKTIMQLKWGLPLVVTTAFLSVLAISLNLVFLFRICLYKPVNLINILGFFLMLFSILLASYGAIMALYLYKGWSSELRFCQGLTSLKFFSLGACICSLIMLTFQFSLRLTSGEAGERDAVFKGVVFVLEGVMLSGVFSIMSWVKMDDWEFLCCIINPTSHMDKILILVEISYYAILFLLAAKYLLHLFRRKKTKCPYFMEQYYNIESTLFVMILLSFFIWISGYTVTLPIFNLFSSKVAAIIRVCTLMLPLSLHPLIFNLKTACSNEKNFKSYKAECGENDVVIDCDCYGNGTCKACKLKYSDSKLDENVSDQETMLLNNDCFSNSPSLQEETEINHLSAKKNNFLSPKLVCRSPIVRKAIKESMVNLTCSDCNIEAFPLLDKTENSDLFSTTDVEKPQKPTSLDLDVKRMTNQDLTPVFSLNSPRGKPSDFPSFISIDGAISESKSKVWNEAAKSKFSKDERKSFVKDSPVN